MYSHLVLYMLYIALRITEKQYCTAHKNCLSPGVPNSKPRILINERIL